MSCIVSFRVNFHAKRIIVIFVAPVFFAMVRVVFYHLPCSLCDYDYYRKTMPMHIILPFGYREGHSARDVAQPCGILSCGRSTVCCRCCQNVIDSFTTTVVVQAFQSLKRGHQEFRCLGGRFRSRSQTCMSSHARLQPMWERQRCLLF